MKNENWFRELTDIELQHINGGRDGGGGDSAREERTAAQRMRASIGSPNLGISSGHPDPTKPSTYQPNLSCSIPNANLHYSEAGCGYIGLGVGTAAGAFAATTGVGVGASGLIGNAVGMAATNACNSSGSGKGGSIGGSCSSSSSSGHCSSNGGFGGGSCSW